ncbi:MAG TPA: EAL domain-containing protein [Acidisarcina sp.]
MDDSGSNGLLQVSKHPIRRCDLTMAFQPFVDVNDKSVYGYEALVRGTNNEPASDIFAHIAQGEEAGFDLACTALAIDLASTLNVSTYLGINLSRAHSGSIDGNEAHLIAAIARARDFPVQRVMIEITESRDRVIRERMPELLCRYKAEGFATAIDRFGLGDLGLDVLGHCRPDAIKLSTSLVRDIDADPVQCSVIAGIAQVCNELGIQVIAVGVETAGECRALRDAGVHLFQGYLFAHPGLNRLPAILPAVWPGIERRMQLDRRRGDRDLARGAGRGAVRGADRRSH